MSTEKPGRYPIQETEAEAAAALAVRHSLNRPLLCGLKIFDHFVDLSRKNTQHCVFDGCVVAMWRGPGHTVIRHNKFIGCKLIGDGWPEDLLASAGGAK